MAKGGICYELALRAMTEGTVDHLIPKPVEGFGPTYLELVHGFPIGKGGNAKGKKYCHAWVEVVMELPLGNNEFTPFVYGVIDCGSRPGDVPRLLPQFVYYKVGEINADECLRYTEDQAADLAIQHGHYGPWLPLSQFPKGVFHVNDDGNEATT